MKITTAYELQSKFQAGLQMVGENFEKELEWIGSTQQWDKVNQLINDYELQTSSN